VLRSWSGRKPRADCQASLGVGVIGVGGRDAGQTVCSQLGLGRRSVRCQAGASSRGWLASPAGRSLFQRALDPEAVRRDAETGVRKHRTVVSDSVLHARQQAAQQ